ncbi:aldehyde dehydrogenase family protein [Acinetobacter baumannii]
MKFGHYADASNDFGPLITQAHKDKVQAYIQSAEQQGAKKLWSMAAMQNRQAMKKVSLLDQL